MRTGRTPFFLVGAGCLVASLLTVWVSGDNYPPVTAWFQNALFFLGVTGVEGPRRAPRVRVMDGPRSSSGRSRPFAGAHSAASAVDDPVDRDGVVVRQRLATLLGDGGDAVEPTEVG